MITFELILRVVCKEFKLTPSEILCPDRTPEARKGNKVFARKLCMTFARLYNLNTEEEIGKAFNRDRTTVYSAVKTVSNDILTSRHRKLTYDNILAELEKVEPLIVRKKIYVSCPKDLNYDNYDYQDVAGGGLEFQIPR